MFNIIPQPTVLAFIAWLAYLVVALPLFLRPARTGSSSTPSPDRPAAAGTVTATGTATDPRAGTPTAQA